MIISTGHYGFTLTREAKMFKFKVLREYAGIVEGELNGYKVTFTPDDYSKAEDGYVVTFADLPEAITQGDTFGDAMLNAEDCLEEALANKKAMSTYERFMIKKDFKKKYEKSFQELLAEEAAEDARIEANKQDAKDIIIMLAKESYDKGLLSLGKYVQILNHVGKLDEFNK